MKFQNIIRILICLAGCVSLPGNAQVPADVDSVSIDPKSTTSESDCGEAVKPKSRFFQGMQFTGGQLTLPFKIRSKAENNSFRLTTDVTVGAYIGLTKPLSKEKNYRLIIPLAAGLTFININDSNTSLDLTLLEAEVVPGLTWSTGIILELEKYSFGLMFGKDYASEVGNQWNYHKKMWWSFGIGFTFFH